VDSSAQGLIIQAEVNFTNPTKYSATIPYLDIMIETNGTNVGHAKLMNATIGPGNNTGLIVQAVWEPEVAGGKKGVKVGKELLSQYISGIWIPTSL
jgi:hypothetical protein